MARRFQRRPQPESRVVFRAALSVDDAPWARARGWALTRVLDILYYKDTNPEFAANGLHTIEEVLADRGADA